MIEVDQLSKSYGSTDAIKNVSFKVEPGEILGFLGPNGAGKTTTMRILTGYLPATTGTARVAGKDVHSESMAVRQSIGYLPEIPPLYPEMTVEGFLHFVARIKGVSAGDRATKVVSAIERCNLQEKSDVIIRKLSKGFRQRVGIAQAIVHNPPVIVLDEPTVGLDPRQIIEVRNLIRRLAGEHTIILSTHILPEVSATCDRIAIINRGELITTDSPEHLVAKLTGQGYWVELAGDADRSIAVLSEIPGVTRVEPVAGEELPEGHTRFQVTTGLEDLGGAIATQVVSKGLSLFELKRNRASLEDVFINLTTTESAVDSPDQPIPPDQTGLEQTDTEPADEENKA
ncbi:MAG: MFS transporter [Leptolyngbya foveolarum]|uniref:MFS transporter n=1 Tax=Leptolyngbya foveolarum TaxID=47253 RepID=A0A2W4UP04_9CYAN|nr:MAG: MFS transporter [Leptolyngbya foveolarum]